MAMRIANNAGGTLNDPITTTGQTTCTLQSGEGSYFSDCGGNDWCYATIASPNGVSIEIVKVTNRSGDVLTIVRGQDGTSATTFPAGSRIERRWNRATVQQVAADAVKEPTYGTSGSGSVNIDLALWKLFQFTLTGATAFSVSNPSPSGTLTSFLLDLTNGGSYVISWWSGIKWKGGTAPTLTAAGRDVLGFYSYDGGATWVGLLLAKDVK